MPPRGVVHLPDWASGGGFCSGAAGQLHGPRAALHLKSGALAAPPVLTVKANLRPASGGSAGLIVAFDPAACTVRAVLDSADLTAMRTGAIAAVAAGQLAGPGLHSLALLGAGPVARQALAALSHVADLGAVRVWSRDSSRAAQFSLTKTQPVTAFDSPEQAGAGAGIVLTALPSRQPLVTSADLDAGVPATVGRR